MKKILIITTLIMSILLFDKVNASNYDVKWINGAQWKVLGGNYATASVDGGAFYSFTDSLSNNSKTYIIKFNNGPIITPSNSKEYLFNVKLNMSLPNGASIYNNQYTCTINSALDVTNGAITDYSVGYPTSEYEDIEYWYKSFTCNASYGSIEMEEVKFAITMFYWVDNNESAHQPCYAQSNAGQNYSFVCPVSIGLPNINGVVVKIWSNATTNFTFGLNDLFNINLDSNQEIINNQQQQMQQQQQNYNNFMNETQQYNDQQNTNISGVNETMQYEQAEQQLIQSIDTNTSIIDEIAINPLASAYIWDIVGGLRSMNPAIIVLMTSMLGFGIVKLILNR